MHVHEFGGVVPVVDEHPERPARVHRLELRLVAHEQHFRAGLFGEAGDAIEGAGAGQGCLIEDHELVLAGTCRQWTL